MKERDERRIIITAALLYTLLHLLTIIFCIPIENTKCVFYTAVSLADMPSAVYFLSIFVPFFILLLLLCD